MQRKTAIMFGFLVLALGLIGLVAGEKQLFGFLNIDIALDVARLALAAILLYAGFAAKTMKAVQAALVVLGIMYLGVALGGFVSPELGGLLPHELSLFDKLFHLVAGLAALGVAFKSADQGQPAHVKV